MTCAIFFRQAVMNITLAMDEQVAQRAREAAQKMGRSCVRLVEAGIEPSTGTWHQRPV